MTSLKVIVNVPVKQKLHSYNLLDVWYLLEIVHYGCYICGVVYEELDAAFKDSFGCLYLELADIDVEELGI